MDSHPAETLALRLLEGVLPAEAQPWDIGAGVRWIADSLAHDGAGIVATQVRAACKALNEQRHFDQTRLLGDAWRAQRGFDATLQRQLAQAMINLSALDAAQDALRQGIELLGQGSVPLALAEQERLEYEGLLARVSKQRFVRDGDPEQLRLATEAYLQTYRRHARRPFWHGINAMALLARQEREGQPLPADGLTADALADELERRLLEAWTANPADPRLAAMLAEATLALGRCDEAELWLYRFLHHPATRPFDIDSLDRQLREIWQGNPLGPGPGSASRLAGVVAGHMLRSQARLSVSSSAVQKMARQLADDPAGFERNFSGERTIGLDLLRNMLASCASIGCVSNHRGERLGSGFLVRGDMLHAGWGEQPVFVTNAHVIGSEVPHAIAPADAQVSFEVESDAAGAPLYHPVAELLHSSPPGPLGLRCDEQDHLDVSIVRLKDLDAALPGLDPASRLPVIDARARAFVVGHPLGGGLQVSLHDSQLLDIDDDERLIHYRTPTDPGSSGSPVFNAAWKVIGLHHGGSPATPRLHGSGAYEANEAIALAAIRRKLAA
jgi:S1-C subfamily serine protease